MTASIWLSKERVCELEGCSPRTLDAKANSGELRWRYADGKSRNGRPNREFSVESLSPAAQMKYFEQQQRPAVSAALIVSDPSQPTLFEGVPVLDSKALVNLDAEQQSRVRERFAIITPLLQWEDGERPRFALPDGSEVQTKDDLALYLGNLYGLSRATIWNYFSAWKKHGPPGLLRDRRDDAGVSRYWAKTRSGIHMRPGLSWRSMPSWARRRPTESRTCT